MVKTSFNNIDSKYSARKHPEVSNTIPFSNTSGREGTWFEIEQLNEGKILAEYRFIFTVNEYYENTVKQSEENSFTLASIKNPDEEKLLVDLYESKYHIKREMNKIPTWLFVYADFVKPSLMADCYSNVLKLLPYKQNYSPGQSIFYTFTPLDFFTVNKDSVKSLSFELRSHAGEIHDFRDTNNINTTLTLFFTKISD
jgi:hypothetical protein